MAAAAWLAVFGHRGLAPCAGVMALSVALRRETWSAGFGLLYSVRRRPTPLSIAFVAMIAFAVWVALTAFWSPVPGAGWLGLTILVSVLSAGALVFEATRASASRARTMAAFYAAMVAIAAMAFLFEGISGAYLRSVIPPEDLTPQRWKDFIALGRGVTAIAPLVFPAAILLRWMSGSWIVAAAPALALFVAAIKFSIFSNVIGLIFGAIAFAAALSRPRLSVNLLSALIIAALLLAPFAAAQISAASVLDGDAEYLPTSWAQRLVIWRHTAVLTLDQCLPFGCGADYARALSEKGVTVGIPGWPLALPVMPIHPHNLFLQVWLELGLPGVLAFALALTASARALQKAPIGRSAIAAICAVASVSFVSVMFEASLWQAWRLAVLALAAFGCAVAYSLEKLRQ